MIKLNFQSLLSLFSFLFIVNQKKMGISCQIRKGIRGESNDVSLGSMVMCTSFFKRIHWISASGDVFNFICISAVALHV